MKKLLLFFILSTVVLFGGVGDSLKINNTVYPSTYFIHPSIEGASIAKVTATDKGSNVTFTNPYTNNNVTYWAGTFTGTLDNNPAKFYCIDIRKYLAFYTPSQPHTYTDSNYTPSQITYILNNYYPYKTYPYPGSASTVQKEAAAVQFAIWYFSDGVDANTITSNADIKNRALAIIADANANAGSTLPVSTLLFLPASQNVATGTTVTFQVAAYDTNGNPLQNRTINLSTTSGTLSATSAVTGVNGLTPLISLTQGSGNTATITAVANVIIPQGTRFVHTIQPNDYQKLVLATPVNAAKSVTSSITWYTPQNCDLNGFVTYTQGGWGGPDNSGPGTIRKNNFATVFPSGLTIGGGSNKATFTTSNAIKNYLPAGGTAGALSGVSVNPVTTSSGVLGGQITALMLNVYFDSAGVIGPNPVKLGNLVIASGPFQGKTVYEFLAIANLALSGASTGYTFSQINDAATAINENFDNGSQDNGFLTCAVAPLPASIGDRVWFDADKDGYQDANESGVAGIIVKLYTCSDVLVATTATNATGYYSFTGLTPGSYYVKFEIPSSYVVTVQNSGTDDTKDSDIDSVTFKTSCTVLISGEEDLSWDAGIYDAPAVCATDWTGTLGPDSAICVTNAQWITISGSVNLTPDPSKAKLQISWRIVHPAEFDTSYNYSTVDIYGDTTFSISAWWPGIRSTDTLVEIHYGVNVLDCQGNVIHNGIGRDLYWYPWVCPAPPANNADISVTKTANKDSLANGESITFTITATNLGPQNATGVKILDQLPAGLDYVSHTASVGSYDELTGVWDIGNLANGASATLTITANANVLASGSGSGSISLGPVGDFNLFVLRDLNQPSSDTEGKVAVGRSANLAGYSVGDKLPVYPFGQVDVLVVGHNLTYLTGAVYNGNVVYGNSSNLPIYAVSTTGGTVRKDSVIDFVAAEAYLTNLSAQLYSFAVNGTTTYQWGGVFLEGTHPTLNVFRVNGDSLSLANDLQIHVPNGSVVVVNFVGDTIQWRGGFEIFGTARNNVLLNLYNVDYLDVRYIDITGSMLAPTTDVLFESGVMHGQMICRSMRGRGQFNISPFLGNIPVDSNLVNVAQVLSSSPQDPVSANNSDMFAFKVKDIQQSTGSGSNWQLVTNFPQSEVVLTLGNDQNGNMLTGTMGGKVYRSTDNGANWTRINNSMNVGYIWSLAVNGATIYAATEQGLYYSTDNGATWDTTELYGKDVRAVTITPNGNIYAGTWGFGIYVSTDNGATWNVTNNGLTAPAVHALIALNNNTLLAGTFGGGVFRSIDGGATWGPLPVGFDFIWSMAKTSTGSIIAGTYGGGIFRSTDGGDSWFQSNDGINSLFIYSVAVDANDNVYVSAWAAGVYVSSANTLNWRPIGLQGHGAGSMFVNLQNGAVFVGTSSGAIFRNDNPTAVTAEELIPAEFALSQNYPNPFNPSTKITFSVPSKSSVSLDVFNILGQKIMTLLSGEYNAGTYTVEFNASRLSSGVYFYRLQAGEFSSVKKMILQK